VADRKTLQSTIGCLLARVLEFFVKDFCALAKDGRRGKIAHAEQEGVVEKWDA